jgi:small subunit ribosomal protein S8
MLTDPIADMFTRIRNAGQARKTRLSLPSSRMKREIARVLQECGYITGFSVSDEKKKPVLTIDLRYDDVSLPMIAGIERVSRPGRRMYVRCAEIPRVRGGLGMAILSTPRGILTDADARDAGVGGELLARVW